MLSLPPRPRTVLLAACAGALSMAGCVSILPKSDPVQLYRLSEPPPPPVAAAPPGLTFTRTPIAFPADAAGDRLLTVQGQEAAFVARARWLEPASIMFDQAVTDAFDQPGSPHLQSPSADLNAKASLRLSVRRFQVDYDQGLGAAPVVEVTVDAMLIRRGDRMVTAEKLFDTHQRASDNRVTAIVQAYGAAVAQTVGGVRDWATANAPQ